MKHRNYLVLSMLRLKVLLLKQPSVTIAKMDLLAIVIQKLTELKSMINFLSKLYTVAEARFY